MRSVFQLLWLVSTIPFAQAAQECLIHAHHHQELVQELDLVNARLDAIEELLQGQLPNQTTLIVQELERTANVDLVKIQPSVQLPSLLDPLKSVHDCDEPVEKISSIKRQITTRQDALQDARRELALLPEMTRQMLARQLNAWDAVNTIQETTLGLLVSVETQTFLEGLSNWTEDYQHLLQNWLPYLVFPPADKSTVDSLWQRSLEINRPRLTGDRLDPALQNLPEIDAWLQTLGSSRIELQIGVSKWRNGWVWDRGWSNFAGSWISPLVTAQDLWQEIKFAPKSLTDNLTRPFMREYYWQQKYGEPNQLITSLFLQVLAISLSLTLLIRIAEATPLWLAHQQQKLMGKLASTGANYFVNAGFRLLKPNASWFLVWVGSQAVAANIPASWFILAWLGPIGSLYAAFRAMRVIGEWLLSRTYTRPGDFLPSSTSEQLVHDTRRFSWAVVICGLIWWLSIATGGGYLRFLIILLLIAVAWWVLFWVMSRHSRAVNKFFYYVLDKKSSGEKVAETSLLAFAVKWFWPALFILAHIADLLVSLNQSLLVFDFYRALSVKILRVRLESKVEEVDEEDSAEPDQRYSDWMLRERENGFFLEIGDREKLLEPMNRWIADKADDNLLLVVGDQGSGKTTLLKNLPNIWKEAEYRFLDIPAKVTDTKVVFEIIAETLECAPFSETNGLELQDDKIEPKVVVIDSAQNLFMTEVGYLEGYKALMQCLTAHLKNVFWIVSMHTQSWSYIGHVFARQQRISSIYRMPRWSPQEIRKLILSRHQGSRRRLRYNELLFSAAASSESSSVRAADSRVFNILWEQSGGNPQAALELWLSATKIKQRIVEVGVPQRPSPTLLANLKDDLYFVYTAIIVHRSLSTREIMLVTHFAEPVVRHALKQGLNVGLIKREADKRYAVDSCWLATCCGFLQRKNLLWD